MLQCHVIPLRMSVRRGMKLIGMIFMFMVVVFSAQQVTLHWGAQGKRNMHQVRIELVFLDFLLRPNLTLLLRFAAFASVHCPL
jgi:hypothetical protein